MFQEKKINKIIWRQIPGGSGSQAESWVGIKNAPASPLNLTLYKTELFEFANLFIAERLGL